jgi:chromosome segregation ATPase
MVKAVQDAARVVAENMMLIALSRLIMALGVPVILASVFWVSHQIVALDRRVALVEDKKPETDRRIAEVERQNQRTLEDLQRANARLGDETARITNRFASIEAGIATLIAQQAGTQRAIERLERTLDGRRD